MDGYPPPAPAPMPQMGPQKPGMFTAVSIMTLISGISNIILSLIWSASLAISLVGILCVPFTLAPGVLGIFEIIYAAKLLANPPKPAQPSQAIAIMEICCILIGSIFSVASGVIALVAYNDPAVKAYFAQINAQAAMPPQQYPPQQQY